MFVHDCMTSRPVTIRSDETLATAHAIMESGRFRRLPVVDDDILVGILSEYDLRDSVDRLDRVAVRAAMTREPFTVAPLDTLEHAVTIIRERQIGALPVVEYGHLVGIITAKDLWIAEPRALPEWDRSLLTVLPLLPPWKK
jgi:acetoin utilization protein AcuB